MTRRATSGRTLLGLRVTEAGVEHWRVHVPQDELLVAAKRWGAIITVTRDGWHAHHGSGAELSGRSPGHLLEQIERLFPATSDS
jgi:hypothetical protein